MKKQLCIVFFLLIVFQAFFGVKAQTIRKVEIFSPAIGNASNNEVAVVNSTGLVYIAGQAFGNNIGVIDPNTNSLIKVIRSDPNAPVTHFFSGVNQTTNVVYFLSQSTSNLLAIDGRPTSSTFNQALPLISFPNETIAVFAIDETRNKLYVATTVNGSNPPQSRIHILDINPSNSTFHQTLATAVLPPGQQIGHLAVNVSTNKIYVASRATGGGVFVLNGTTQTVTKIVSTIQTSAIAINETSNTIYAGLNGTFTGGTSSIQAIDGATDTLITNINLPGAVLGTFGELIAVNSTTERVYALLSNNSLSVIDAKRTSPTFNTVLANVPNVGTGAVAVDEGTNKIVVASGGLLTTVIDGATNTIAATIKGNFSSVDVTVNPTTHRAYVGYVFYTTQAINLNDNSFTDIGTTTELSTGIVNPNNNSFYFARSSARADIAYLDQNDNLGLVGGEPHDYGRYLFTAQNTVTNRIYVVNSAANLTASNSAPGFVSVVDGATNNVIANVEVGGQPFNTPAVNEATNKIYVINFGSGALAPAGISVINGATNTASFVNTSALPTNASFQGEIIANPVTNKIYFRYSNSSVGVINGATDIATPLSGFTGVFAIAINRTLNRVYFSTSTGLRVLNGNTDAEIANIPLTAVSNIIVNQTNGRIYAISSTNGTLTAIDGNTNTVINSVSIANKGSIALDQTRNRLYVGNYLDINDERTSSISFVDGNSLAVTKILAIPLRSGQISVNAATRTVYVTTVNASQRTGIVVIKDTASAKPFDFDGDGKADFSVYRPSNNSWYLQQSTAGFSGAQFGLPTDKLAPADYDGDGRTDIAVFREGAFGYFYVLQSQNNTVRFEQFGTTGDVPTPGDYDGDGRADLAVYRNGSTAGAQSYFYYRPSAAPGTDFRQIVWGAAGDKPVVGDYDGDGKTDAAVFRPATGAWYISRTSDNQTQAIQFGASTDKPVAADYDGDGKTDVAVYRSGIWYLQRSVLGFTGVAFGIDTDLPTPADYDGDGRADIAVFRNGIWYIQRSTQGFTGIVFGTDNDKPIPNAFVQ